MAERLDGTAALVTGASSGIGMAAALALAQQGAAVTLVARREDRLEQLAAEITEQGGRALVMPADVTAKENAAAAVERTVAEWGRLDTVINNAGVMLLGPIVEAFEAGTAVACSNATSLPSMVGDAALVFDPQDTESIAGAVEALWSDESLRRQLIERGRARVRLFDPARVAETYRALYRQVAGRRLSPQDHEALSRPPAV